MNRLEKAALRQPTLYAFGTRPLAILTAAEEVNAPFEERLRSCWRYLVRRARRFAAALSRREQCSYNAEDLIQEIVLALIGKDHLWEPARGRYCTFAERVTRNVLSQRRECARIVKAPANALSTLDECRRAAVMGTLTERRADTMRAIERLFGETEVCSPGTVAPEPAATPGDDVLRHELLEALKGLRNPLHALALGHTHGLFGQPALDALELATTLGVEPHRARHLVGSARSSLKDRLRRLRAKDVSP